MRVALLRNFYSPRLKVLQAFVRENFDYNLEQVCSGTNQSLPASSIRNAFIPTTIVPALLNIERFLGVIKYLRINNEEGKQEVNILIVNRGNEIHHWRLLLNYDGERIPAYLKTVRTHKFKQRSTACAFSFPRLIFNQARKGIGSRGSSQINHGFCETRWVRDRRSC